MEFSAQEFLEEYGGDALKALSALAAARDAEGRSAQKARSQRDEARGQIAPIQQELNELKSKVPAEGAVVLTGDDAKAWQVVQEKGGASAITSAFERAGKADELERTVNRTKAAQMAKVPDEAFAEWLGDRQPVPGKVKDAEGKEVETYGLMVGDAFKPLSDFATLQALAQANQPRNEPEPRRIAVGGNGTGGGDIDPVEALNQALFGQRSKT